MEIGKGIASQKNRVIINTQSHAAMKNSVDILRKPTFDAKYFDSGNDANGWWLNGKDQSPEDVLDYIKYAPPFSIIEDPTDTGSTTLLSIAVKTGQWTRIIDGAENNYKVVGATGEGWTTDYFGDNDTLFTNAAQRDEWLVVRKSIGTYSALKEYMIWIELVDATDTISSNAPTKCVLHIDTITSHASYSFLPSTNEDAYRLIGYVRLNEGVMVINQYHTGYVVDNNLATVEKPQAIWDITFPSTSLVNVSKEQITSGAAVSTGRDEITTINAGSGFSTVGDFFQASFSAEGYIYLAFASDTTATIIKGATLPAVTDETNIVPLWYIAWDTSVIDIPNCVDLRTQDFRLPTTYNHYEYQVLQIDSAGLPAWDWVRFHV